ncbi:hypothetical protein IJ847_00790 [Candidatus Saccharibacteria bacterium]|nr:hypothetical protein [Candidatus Saccharibacteria bacterium]
MNKKDQALFDAISHFDAEKMKAALADGANVNAKDHGFSALLILLSQVQNINIPKALDCVKILLDHNIEVDKNCLAQIVRIGQSFEFHREAMAQDFIAEVEPALKELYSIFDVEPVPPKRNLQKGERISVNSKRWQTQHDELWDLLAPSKGRAKTVQGEVIRISGRISYELLDNGGINWDKDYELMLQELPKLWQTGSYDKEALDELSGICDEIIEHNGDFCNEEKVGRLSQLCVEWILRNPDIVELSRKLPYKR